MLRLAKRQATQSQFKRARVGAVICKGDRILSSGYNQIRYTKYLQRPFPESVHAEQAAIVKLLKEQRFHDLIGATLYVCRIGRDGAIRLARPCPACNAAIKAVGIKRVIYTINDGTTGEYSV